MTTIAYKDGILACDSRLTLKSMVCTDRCKKIWRLKDGSLFGARGDNEAGLLLLDGLQKNKKPRIPQDAFFEAIKVTLKGEIYFYVGWELWDRWPEDFVAIGSGGKYAKAAMLNGADAVAAVKTGIAMDVYSGGEVQTLKLRAD